MSPQTVVDDEPVQAYEGKVQHGGQYPTTFKSFLADGLIYFGKAVSLIGTGELAVGGASGGPQAVKLPAAATDVTTSLFQGVAPADPSIQRTRTTGVDDPFGAYIDETSVQVLRKGLVWVVVTTAIADITIGVFVQRANAGGSPPALQLGSFDTVTTADNTEITSNNVSWAGAAVIGSQNFGLLELNLP